MSLLPFRPGKIILVFMTLSHESPAPLTSTGPGGVCKWPSNDFVAGEPLFDRPLTESDLDALQEEAGLGPASWWLDPFMATKGSGGSVGTPNYEDEVALTAWAREPFECAGEIRDASRGLLNRLNELIHLQNLAQSESQRKSEAFTKGDGKDQKLSNIYHSTLSLAASEAFQDGSVGAVPKPTVQPTGARSSRKGTYAVLNNVSNGSSNNLLVPPRHPLTSSPKINQHVDKNLVPPRSSKSPDRHGNKLDNALARTYSKESLNMLTENQTATLQRNNDNKRLIDSDDGSENILNRTYDADELSDVFPSVRGSFDGRQSHEAFNPKPPPLNQSAQGPTTGPRRLTYNANANSHSTNRTFDILEIARQEESSLRASAARSEQRSNSGQNSLRGSAEILAANRAQRFGFSEKLAPRTSESPSRNLAASTSNSRERLRRGGPLDGLPVIPASPLDAPLHKMSDVGPSVTSLMSSLQLPAGQKEVRSSLPTSLSANALGITTKLSHGNTGSNSGSGSLVDVLEEARMQEASLRASSGSFRAKNRSGTCLTQSLESSKEEIFGINNSPGTPEPAPQSVPMATENVSLFARRPVKAAEASMARSRPPIDRKRAALGSSSANDLLDTQKLSTSNASLRSITSEDVQKMVMEQDKSLRASAEEILKAARLKNLLSKSAEGLITLRKSADNLSTSVGDGGVSPTRAASPAQSATMPIRSHSPLSFSGSQRGKDEHEPEEKSVKAVHSSGSPITDPFQLAKQQAARLRESSESYGCKTRTLRSDGCNDNVESSVADKLEQTSSSGSAQSVSARVPPPVRPSVSPVRMRRRSRKIPPKLDIPQQETNPASAALETPTPTAARAVEGQIDDKLTTPVNPRPSSYTDHLMNPVTPASAVEAWVSETVGLSEIALPISSSIDSSIAPPADPRASADPEAVVSSVSLPKTTDKPPPKGASSSTAVRHPSGLPQRSGLRPPTVQLRSRPVAATTTRLPSNESRLPPASGPTGLPRPTLRTLTRPPAASVRTVGVRSSAVLPPPSARVTTLSRPTAAANFSRPPAGGPRPTTMTGTRPPAPRTGATGVAPRALTSTTTQLRRPT
ncbi:unnamed protein product [Schistocephalus solidus]|uniref:AAA domain-containing protein n=1 Tax=Schistocephalus solidus TaxID=70667 RepID=A0A183TCV0_SCHSO|nr:unnamed protein product [Schistocephalus solidus]